MSTVSTANEDASGRTHLFKLMERVTLKDSVESEEGRVPAGASGTMVHVWSDGVSLEIEFTEPFHAIATVTAHDIVA